MSTTTLLLLVAAAVLLSRSGGLTGWLNGLTTGGVPVGVYDPGGSSPATIQWAAYPAPPPAGFHWQSAGSPGAVTATSPPPTQVLVRDGVTMPMMV